MSDPVAVDAGLMAEADRIMDEYAPGQALSPWRSHFKALAMRDAIAAALQAAEERGAERMREQVLAAFPDEPAHRLRLTCEEVRTAIRALPLSETEK